VVLIHVRWLSCIFDSISSMLFILCKWHFDPFECLPMRALSVLEYCNCSLFPNVLLSFYCLIVLFLDLIRLQENLLLASIPTFLVLTKSGLDIY
jgi:hypothetical protein